MKLLPTTRVAFAIGVVIIMIACIYPLFSLDFTGKSPLPSSHEAVLSDLVVSEGDYSQPYERTNQFGEAWIDTDNNGCDTRNDILARDLTEITTKGFCTVLTGTLLDSYTGIPQPFTRGEDTSSLVQIDHVVSLSNAWRAGANKLTQEKRINLANDPLNLRAINGDLNQQKSDLTADKWLPPLQTARCDYVQTQIDVKRKYELTITPAEKTAMQTVLDGCNTVNG